MPQNQTSTHDRDSSLQQILSHERNITLARVREYRAAQEQEAPATPGDELDAARALSDVETHASLIERAEERLRSIDLCFNLLERGRYGLCAKCGEEIPLERLKVVPFATFCIDCQQSRDRARHLGEGRLGEPFARNWDLPEEMAEPTEGSHDEFVALPQEGPEEEAPAFGELELGEGAGSARKGRRPRAAGRPRAAVKPRAARKSKRSA
ncbi:MAG TPA: TraR/DksA family transcriptional regulator [Candidatus Binataceae bacterium]|jgi:DnaK suppressor protein|nr:TraR/DksA family transcriptional regulator [Candidatus Binataceae bacterium]